MTDRPVFPDSLPVKPNFPPPSPRPTVAVKGESTSTIKIVLAVLIFGVLANLGLTLWLHKSHENAQLTEADAKDARMIDELVHLRSELQQAKSAMALSNIEINRLKTEYATVAGMVASRGSVNSPMIPGRNSTPRVVENSQQIESKPK